MFIMFYTAAGNFVRYPQATWYGLFLYKIPSLNINGIISGTQLVCNEMLIGTHFGLDLMHRKAEVKDIITDVINNMSDEEDEGEDAENDGDADKDDDGDDDE